MKKSLIAALGAIALLSTPMAFASESIDSDPSADADCIIALLTLSDQADGDDEDAIITMAMYYFGRLGGEGQANASYLLSRMGRFADDESLYLTEAESCISDFETEGEKFAELAKLLE
ncbi:MAG: hypothetical protein Pars2KO_21060 [Parasphingorhabdus sp.]